MRIIWLFLGCIVFLTACSVPPTRSNIQPRISPAALEHSSPIASFTPVSFQSLGGWNDDSLAQAWPAWLQSCQALRKKIGTAAIWIEICNHAQKNSALNAKVFFETYFQAYEIRNSANGNSTGLITAYYEPILNGSRVRTERYKVALYAYPKAWTRSKPIPTPTREELLRSGVLKGSEIAWVEDPVAAASMQIQGSGKIRLDDGNMMRLGFAGTNDHSFKSSAQWLIDRREIARNEASMQGIAQWAKRNPGKVDEMLNANPRFVFFKELPSLGSGDDLGPIGALGVPLTAGRSIAVDPRSIPLGAPVFLDTTEPNTNRPLRRLVMAQDTGNAIVGAVRADYYWGSGDLAGEFAGRMKQNGQMWLLLPRKE